MLRIRISAAWFSNFQRLTCGCRDNPYRGADENLLRKAGIRHVRRPCDSQERDDGNGEDREVSGLNMISD